MSLRPSVWRAADDARGVADDGRRASHGADLSGNVGKEEGVVFGFLTVKIERKCR